MAGEGSCLRLPDSELSRIMRSNLHKHVRENSWVKSEESGIGKLRALGRRTAVQYQSSRGRISNFR